MPSNSAASLVVLAVPDAGTGRNTDLQSELNRQPKKGGTAGVNEEAVKILEDVLSSTSSSDEFRTELNRQLTEAGHDASKPVMDIRV
ncbi:hypothetical protein [Phaeobacter gallaeciensis]|uniref:hypothetical protein n=1 Tax=Phaeobacter gallaeciensis TaxID=60890 RepID=UPI000BBBD726|nr:hypothetical protein [Phaeobacter gallaeciensis]ATF18421.1 hypothetical protein PhaeoP129_01792 [Phaeobacter gallaeciensis]ATF22530.1 hypothetical protein PhaeoP128_01792 [Phaeobacter gallaeciensis]